VEWVENTLELGRDMLVEWIQSDNFYYETDSWIELATSYVGKLLKIVPIEKWQELLTIMKDPEEDISSFIRRIHAVKYQRDMQELGNLNVELKEAIEAIESIFEDDEYKLFDS